MEENIKVEVDMDYFPIKEEMNEDKDDILPFSSIQDTSNGEEQDINPKMEIKGIFHLQFNHLHHFNFHSCRNIFYMNKHSYMKLCRF